MSVVFSGVVSGVFLALALSFLSAMASAAPTSVVDTGQDAPRLLEIWVNGSTRHVVATVTQRGPDLLAGADDVRAAGLLLDESEILSDGNVAINRLGGVMGRIRPEEQRLDLTVPVERMAPQTIDLRGGEVAPSATSDTGFIGSYDLVGTANDLDRFRQGASAGAALGGTLFTPAGLLSSDGFARTQDHRGFTRLNSTAEYDDVARTRRWLVGDAVTGGLSWSRSARFAGLQMASDFSLRPDLNTMPLPAFFGQTAVPSTVDVFVNSARVFEGNVDAGPFQINNLPVITGNGQVTVVTRDALGQQTTFVLPFYASNRMLREGLEAYDVDIGAVRTFYGQKSFSYGEAVATATYSRGVTDWLTAEAHAEATHDIQLGGVGASFSLGSVGVLHAAMAQSSRRDVSGRKGGTLFNISAESQRQPFGFFGSATKTIGRYADIAARGGTPPPTLQLQFGASAGLGTYGSAAVSWIKIRNEGAPPTQLVSGSYTFFYGSRWNFGVTGFYDMTRRETVSEAVFTLSLDDRTIAHASASRAERADQQEIGVTRPANLDGGVGYNLSASDGQTQAVRGDVNWINSRGNFDAAFSSRDGVQAGQLTASGSVVAMGGSVHATQRPNGAIALVRTGKGGTHVYHENRDEGVTDEDGELLLTNFAPFAANRVSIDPTEYDLSTAIDTPVRIVVPKRQSGVIVDMAPERRRPYVLVLRMGGGAFPSVGARVTLDDASPPTIVGHHGEVFLADLQKPVKGTVQSDGGSCRFDVTPSGFREEDPIPRIDPVPCIGGTP